MKKLDLKRIARRTASSTDPVSVLVSLKSSTVDEACLERLRAVGLAVSRVVKSTVLGTIAANQLAGLRAQGDVREVEVSAQLRVHGAGENLKPKT